VQPALQSSHIGDLGQKLTTRKSMTHKNLQLIVA